jgi:hypothetical protein
LCFSSIILIQSGKHKNILLLVSFQLFLSDNKRVAG